MGLIGVLSHSTSSWAVWKSNFGRPTPSTVPARWRGVFRPSTRCCRRDCVGSMAWKFTKVHAISQDNLNHWLISTQVLRRDASYLYLLDGRIASSVRHL